MANLADIQHGVVSHAQLLQLGYSEAAVGRALRSGRLYRAYRGAYAVGHPHASSHGLGMAAVLSCGGEAMLSHLSAAWLWGLVQRAPSTPEVTLPMRGHTRKGIVIHHSQILESADRTKVEGIPTTAVPRTLIDLASRGSQRRLVASALERAERLGLLELGEVDALLARSGTHSGKASLRAALDIYRDPGFTRSRAELLFLDLVERAGLPRPATNLFVAGHEIDAYWESERFAVEVDGWDTHKTREAFEADPVRQEDLKLAGIDSIRLTARRIENEPSVVGRRLTILLDRRRAELRATLNQD